MANNVTIDPRKVFKRNLEHLIDSHETIHGSLDKLSTLSGITRQGLSKLLKGNTSNPGLSTLVALSNTFGITVSQLIGQLPLEAKFTTEQHIKHVPVLLWQKATQAKLDAPKKHLANWDDWTLTKISLSQAAYALRVESNFLKPHFHFGDMLIIDPEVEPADNDYVIVQSKECEKARIKKIVTDGNLWLHSLIDEHPPIELTKKNNTHEICGVILQSTTLHRDE